MPTSTTTQRLAALCLSSAILVGCAATPNSHSYADQARRDFAPITNTTAEKSEANLISLPDLIGSNSLNALISRAVDANPSLQQTLLTLKISQMERRQTGAARLPELDAGLNAAKQDTKDSSAANNDTSYSGSLTLNWQLDVWGKLNDRYLAAAKDIAEQQALYQSAKDALAAEVITAWLNSIALGHAIDIESQRHSSLEQTAKFIENRYRSGLGKLEDIDTARSAVYRSKATMAEYAEDLARQRRALSQLLGQSDLVDYQPTTHYPDVLLPIEALPNQNLQRRPDLQAAYLAIEAKALRSKAAYKDMLPSLSLQAALTDSATSLSSALLKSPAWSLLGQLVAPIYRGGELRAAAKIADLETAQGYQVFREALLTAVAEVEDALGSEQELAKRQRHITDALAAAERTEAQYQSKYRAGLVDILDLLSVQQQNYDLAAQLDNLIYQRLANRITLGLALGLGVQA
ncbi:TolC family protein [Zhongshania borealis]|uniref:Efflux transporter outer membrane subunit n=1 Tax=Zhongshania borealis TaxID=889488 RepID=A0ABP7WT41_9GAMM